MKKLAGKSVFLIFTFIIASCSPSIETTKEISKVKTVKTKLGLEYSYIFNNDSTFVLCLKNNKIPGKNALDIQLLDVEKDTVTFQAVFPGGNVGWINNSQFEVNVIPGNVNDEEKESDLHFTYDVHENKIINKDRK